MPSPATPRSSSTRIPAAVRPLADWMRSLGWRPFPFQRRAWVAFSRGQSGLIHVPTGAGKTYAACFGPMGDLLRHPPDGLGMLYITPLRAVSRDVESALKRPLQALGVTSLRVETRTGDTSTSLRARQKQRLPAILVTTPESLTLLLTQPDAAERFAGLRAVVLDEWHELLSTKRGTQTELALARLRRFSPNVRTWALSATISNLDDALQAAVGTARAGTLITARIARPIVIDSVLPTPDDPFPWAGHLGMHQLERVVATLDPTQSTLIFVNTRSQAERWFHAITLAKPEWRSIIALHHGSIDRAARERVEQGLKDGSIRIVVATSSLDLGVDFAPVQRVVQIGSPKGIARLMQRAGRASHQPGQTCRITCVPTHGLEMIEVAAVRRAIAAGHIEPRKSQSKPLDVLTQHLVTCALGGGFHPDDLYDEVRTAHAYRDLTRDEFEWALRLVRDGGEVLGAYPEYRRIAADEHGIYRVENRRLAALHRFNVGTITGDATMEVRFMGGRRIGSIEENFIAGLKPGQRFFFAGRNLELVTVRDLTAYVRSARRSTNLTPIWSGTRLPISESLSEAVRTTLACAREGTEPELRAAARLVRAQLGESLIPGPDELLCETCTTRDGTHLFVYPFEGRLVHGGLAALLALRLGRRRPGTFAISVNDYGFELLSDDPYPFASLLDHDLFATEALARDVIESVNLSALARNQFREVARVSGLVFQNYPGAQRGMRHLQARAGLLYDVFEQFDPDNLLMHQARREVIEQQFEQSRLARLLRRLGTSRLRVVATNRPTPLALPLVVERIRGRISLESLDRRIEKIQARWKKR
ncbi:MAG: ligase-associated DNA damage response DEXH box helicase [Phycisphaerales bacterium]